MMKTKMARMIYLMIPMVAILWMAPFLGACSTGSIMGSSMAQAGSSIRIGSGGGFSGIFSGYLFDDDGSVYSWKVGPGEFEDAELLFTERDSVQHFFALLDQIGFRSYQFDHPGNMTDFVELSEPNDVHAVRWGAPELSPPPGVADLHRTMLSYAQRRSTAAR